MFCRSYEEGEELILDAGLPEPIIVKVLHVGKNRVKLGVVSDGATQVIRLAVPKKDLTAQKVRG